MRALAAMLILVGFHGGREVTEALGGQTFDPAVFAIGDCRIELPIHPSIKPSDHGMAIDLAVAHCPPELLHSLGFKADLKCATRRDLIRLQYIGFKTATRILKSRHAMSWKHVSVDAGLSRRQLHILRQHFVIADRPTSCSF